MEKNRTLVDRALKKAEEAERQGDNARARHFFALAERAEEVYKKIENRETDILKT